MSILAFLMQNWDSVLVVILVISAVIFFYMRGEKQILKQILFSLVTKAENLLGTGTGVMKYSLVLEWIYEKMPAILRLFITEKTLKNLIEEALAYAKDKWATNPELKEYIETKAVDVM